MTIAEQHTWLKKWYLDHKAELQTQPAMVKAIKADSKVEAIIRDLYLVLFTKTLGGCGSCLADAMVQLYHYPEDRIKAIMECKFKLKSGAVLMDASNKLPNVTNANLTDDLAIAYLRDNRLRECMFTQVPDNLDELLDNKVEDKENQEKVEEPEAPTEKIEEPEKPAEKKTTKKK